MSDAVFKRLATIAALAIAAGYLAFLFWNASAQRKHDAAEAHSERFQKMIRDVTR